jgi:gliding motility-associated-like protein
MVSKNILFILLVLLIVFNAHSTNVKALEMVQNKGQWDETILYRARNASSDIHIGPNYIQYYFFDKNLGFSSKHPQEIAKVNLKTPVQMHGIRMAIQNANKNCLSKHKSLPYYYNFFKGSDPKKWATGVAVSNEIELTGIYKGIDLQINSIQNGIKYTFVCAPKAQIGQIALSIEGADQIQLEYGEIRIKHSFGEMVEKKPFAYQIIQNQEVLVPIEFVLNGNKVSYKITGKYNSNYALYIDPELVFLTYSGSTVDNFGCTATPGEQGTMYTGGLASDPDDFLLPNGQYPVTAGAFQLTYAGGDTSEGEAGLDVFPCDIVLSKYSSDGSKLLWATYLGGTNNEVPHSLIVDKDNNLLVFGTSYSVNYPVKTECYQTKRAGRMDIIVTKFSADGKTLIGSTYVGGADNDGLNYNNSTSYFFADSYRGDVLTDNSGKVIVASVSQSNDFPITTGCHQKILNGFQDGVLFQLDSALTTLEWATYFGGSGIDALYSIDLSKQNEILVSGGTNSTNIVPITANAYQPNNSGDVDGFIAKFNRNSSSLLAATYWGTNLYDQIYSLDIDPNNQVVVVGHSEGNMPILGNVYQNSGSHQFISCFSNDLKTLNWSTVFGSGRPSIDVTINAFMVDDCGRIYVSSWGGSTSGINTSNTTGMAISANAFQSTTDGSDFYLMCLEKNATGFLYGTFIGGANPNASGDHVDGGTSRFDKNGVVYQSMCASCPNIGGVHFISDLKTSANAFSPKNPSPRCSNAALKFDFQIKSAKFDYRVDTCSALFTCNKDTNITDPIKWILPNGDESSDDVITFQLDNKNNGDTLLMIVMPGTACADTAFARLNLPDSASTFKMPNVFSPNDDQINDVFEIEGVIQQCDEVNIAIYNRWGQLMYEANQANFAWNGKDQSGNNASEGIYFVLLSTKKKSGADSKSYHSTLTLIR